MTAAERLEACVRLRQAGLTHKQIAQELGVSTQTVSKRLRECGMGVQRRAAHPAEQVRVYYPRQETPLDPRSIRLVYSTVSGRLLRILVTTGEERNTGWFIPAAGAQGR